MKIEEGPVNHMIPGKPFAERSCESSLFFVLPCFCVRVGYPIQFNEKGQLSIVVISYSVRPIVDQLYYCVDSRDGVGSSFPRPTP